MLFKDSILDLIHKCYSKAIYRKIGKNCYMDEVVRKVAALGKYGIDALLTGIYQEWQMHEPRETLCREINDLPISSDLKRKLREIIGCS